MSHKLGIVGLIKNFGILGENQEVLRSALPTPNFLDKVSNTYGLNSVLNLKSCEKPEVVDYLDEKEMDLYTVSISRDKFPSKNTINKILDVLDESVKPLLIHCQGGADRTTFVSNLYKHIHLNEELETSRKGSSKFHHFKYYALDYLLDDYQNSDSYPDFKDYIDNNYSPTELSEQYLKSDKRHTWIFDF